MKLDGTRKFFGFCITQLCLTVLGVVGTIDPNVCVGAVTTVGLGYLGIQGYLDRKNGSQPHKSEQYVHEIAAELRNKYDPESTESNGGGSYPM